MANDIIKYEIDNKNPLNDLSGTFDDLGQLISYLRDLSRQLVPLVDSIVPLSDTLNDLIANLPNKLEKFLFNNPFFAFTVSGLGLLGIAYLTTGIIRNILEINELRKNN